MPTSKVPTPAEPDSTQVAAEQASSTTPTQPQQSAVQPQESSGGVTVKTGFPYVEFSGEGFPTITSEGTQLSAEEAKAAQEAANAQGVSLIVEGGAQNG